MPIAASHMSFHRRFRRWITRGSTGGLLLLGAAVIALIWANSPWRASYTTLSSLVIGPARFHLDLSLATWASDGLLAVFFFVVGLELKQEIVTGSLHHLRQAAVPVLAAVGGMVAPALIFVALVIGLGDPGAIHGWAVPTATDIAFAVSVLAVFGRGLPRELRVFLLTLAVVDDLLAITVIAVFYTASISWLALGTALACVVIFALITRLRTAPWWALLPVAALAWGFMHASGVHATIAGVLMGLSVPAGAVHTERDARTHRYDYRIRPYSSGLVLPVFAFFAAGVSLVDGEGPLGIVTQPVFIAVAVALVLGKFVGVMGTTWLITRITPLRLAGQMRLRDLVPVGLLTGIGFTVSLLIAELAFTDAVHIAEAKTAILAGSLLSAALGAAALRLSSRQRPPLTQAATRFRGSLAVVPRRPTPSADPSEQPADQV